MANHRDELLRAALQNAQAIQDQVGLDEQYGKSQALRGSQFREPNQYGVVSPLSILATTMRKSRGRRDERLLAPSRDANRKLLGTTSGTLSQGKLGLTLDKAGREKEELGLSKRKTKTLEGALALKQEQEEFKQDVNLEEAEIWIDKGPGAGRKPKEIAVIHDSKRNPWMTVGGKLFPVPDGYVPKHSKGSGVGSSFRGSSLREGDKRKIALEIQSTFEMRRVVGNYKEVFGQPIGLPSAPIDAVVKAFANNDLLGLINSDADKSVKAAAQWWADWRMNFTVIRRNELFGSQLSKHEAKSWKEAEAMNPGMDPKEIEKRMHVLMDAADRSLLRRANMGAIDPVIPNRDVWARGLGDMYAFNPDTLMYSMHPSEKEEQPILESPVQAPLSEITPEIKVAYGQIVMSFDEEQKAIWDTMNPDQKRAALDEMYAEQNTMNE